MINECIICGAPVEVIGAPELVSCESDHCQIIIENSIGLHYSTPVIKYIEPGIEKGEICNRNGCKGIIDEHETNGGCSCHISPPCNYCVTDRTYCPECDYDGGEEQREAELAYAAKYNHAYIAHKTRSISDLDKNKIDYIYTGGGNASMNYEGVYPEGTTRQEVESVVIGSWGGRFEYFTNGRFKYIAYTD